LSAEIGRVFCKIFVSSREFLLLVVVVVVVVGFVLRGPTTGGESRIEACFLS
jgi:hypothetical protein